MPALPPHIAGRPLKPRHIGGNPKTRLDASVRSQQGVIQGLPSQRGDYHPDRAGHGHRLLRSQVQVNTQKSEATDITMSELERVLAAMLRDADLHEEIERSSGLQSRDERRDSGFMESAPVEMPAATSKEMDGAAPRDAKPQAPQSLAVTHPSLYRHPLTKPIANTPAPALSVSFSNVARAESHRRQPQSSVNPRQIHSDPKEPRLPSPTDFDLKMKFREEISEAPRPHFVRSLGMIALPFGALIEVACDYEAEDDNDEYSAQCEDSE